MKKLKHINKMASLYRYATLLTSINHNLFICILLSLLLPRCYDGASSSDEGGRRLTKEYHLRQGALRGLIVKPARQYQQIQNVEMFLGIPYAAPPVGSLRFMPPVSALPWSGVKMATRFAPVCPQSLPPIKKNNPPSLGRQQYIRRLTSFLKNESEDCLYLNIYVPYREQKSKKFPVLVFIHGDSFEWSSGNPYDGKILAAYGNIMVITLNFRLGILGFMKPSLTEHVYGNNGLLDQLAALQWIKDNIEDLNGDPNSVTLMGHGTGAACVNYLMMSPISSGLFHRAILMSGSALADWALTKDPAQYTLQVAQSLGCNPNKNMMTCLQNKSVSDIKKVQVLYRDFETPLGPVIAGSFVPSEPLKTMEAYPNLLSKYQLLCGITELESYHEFGVIELAHGVLDDQRNEFIKKYLKVLFDNGEDVAFKEILKQYAPSKLDPQRWSVEANRDFILNVFSDARTIAPMIKTANFQSTSNRQSYFYVFGHNSESTEYAAVEKSVQGEEMPYILGIPLGGAFTHFHTEYTQKEKLLSEVIMRLWTNFVKIGTPNTQRKNTYLTDADKHQYNIDWPEYNIEHQSYLKLDIPPTISSFYRSNFTKFWIDTLPNKMKGYAVDPLFEYHAPHPVTTTKPKISDTSRRSWQPPPEPRHHNSYTAPSYGYVRPNPPPMNKPDPEVIYREIQAIKTPFRPVPSGLMDKPVTTTIKTVPDANPSTKTSSSTFTIIITLGILFLLANISVCAILYFKKRRLRTREKALETRNSRADIDMCDGVLKPSKDDKSALQTFKNRCSVFKSISIDKIRSNSNRSKKNKLEPCKTPKSDDSGGFRERFQMRRHLSTSTLDANTKVRDWIANEAMHRCSPNILTKSDNTLKNKELNEVKSYTRSEELLSHNKVRKHEKKYNTDNEFHKNISLRTKTSEKTTSTSALGSQSSIGKHSPSLNSIKNSGKSNDSLKSKGNESVKSKKVSVAIDATPAARTNSILSQEPIEFLKTFEKEEKHSKDEIKKAKTATKNTDNITSIKSDTDGDTEIVNKQTFKCEVNLAVEQKLSAPPINIFHKHSTSDPVTDINYDKLLKQQEQIDSKIQASSILPPVSFRNDINMTSRDESIQVPSLSAAEALLTIQRRKYPKVLPDLPNSQKRLSLQPTTFHTFKNYVGSFDQIERPKVPPQPPPRTTTLERRLAYKNTKPNFLSSFDSSNVRTKTSEPNSANYENIDTLSPVIELGEKNKICNKSDPIGNPRDFPKVIIASIDIPNTTEGQSIKPSPSQGEMPINTLRVRLPDDFHSQTTGSITSFSSVGSDDDDDDVVDLDEIDDDKLIQELVGSVDSISIFEETLDSKGPSTIYEQKLEVIPVKINSSIGPLKNKDNYVCISDLTLPDVRDLEKTAKIRPNFGLNKLQNRSESINKPPEKAVKIKPKKNIKPTTILNRNTKNIEGKKKSKKKPPSLEHSTSGSSNDTATSTGTVKKVELKKDT